MEELIKRAQKGDKEAFTEAILLIKNELFDFAYVKVNDVDDANDLVQETMLHAFKSIKTLKEVKYFKTWITKILINECNQYFKRKKHNHDKISKEINNTIDWCIDNVENKLDIESIYNSIIGNLKPIEQNIIILYYGNKYTRKEIAEILNMKEETVKTKLRRIKIKIEKMRNSGREE